MSKTKKTVLIIAGAVLLSLAAPYILFFVIFVASSIGDLLMTQKAVEEYGKKMQPKTGIVFPADTTFVRGDWRKYGIFQERYANWCYTSKEPFQFPEDVKVSIKKDELNELEELFSRLFKTNITEAIDHREAEWMKNDYIFNARVLKTPEQYYLYLDSRLPYPEEREDFIAKEAAARSEIIFPEDTLDIRVSEDAFGYFLFFVAKEPFQLPENSHIAVIEKREKQNDHLVINDDLIYEFEKSFGELFGINISDATGLCCASWKTNTFSFNAKILKTDENNYLELWARKMRPSELEARKKKNE
jgi:hypothetical protein